MLEVHATPLMLATLVLLFLLCTWWLIVEWGFQPPSRSKRPALDDKDTANNLQSSTVETESDSESFQPVMQGYTRQKNKTDWPAKPVNAQIRGQHTDAKYTDAARKTTNNSTRGTTTSTSAATTPPSTKSRSLHNKAVDRQQHPVDTATKKKQSTVTRQNALKNRYKNATETATASSDQEQRTKSRTQVDNKKNNRADSLSVESGSTASAEPAIKRAAKTQPAKSHGTRTTDSITSNKNTEQTKPAPCLNKSASSSRKTKDNRTADKPSGNKTAPNSHTSASASSDTNSPTSLSTNIQQATAKQAAHKQSAEAHSHANKSSATKISTAANEQDTSKHSHNHSDNIDTKAQRKSQPRQQASKYQTAAKAKSPSLRSEASIQIPTPTTAQITSDNRKEDTRNSDSKQALDSTIISTTEHKQTRKQTEHPSNKHEAAKHEAAHEAARHRDAKPTALAQNIHSIGFAATRSEKPNSRLEHTSTVTALNEPRGPAKSSLQRTQSAIELAMAQKKSILKNRTSDEPATAHKTNDLTHQEPAATNPESHTGGRTTATLAADTTPTESIDGDAALRAQLAVSDRRIRTLQSTLNNLQQNMPVTASPKMKNAQQHNRPSLMSKVRVLDQPRPEHSV